MGSETATPYDLKAIYDRRFRSELEFRKGMWGILCRNFFQRWIPADATVLELGAGYCEFINQVRARRRIAVDLNPDVNRFAATGVEVVVSATDRLESVDSASVDVAFASNFFEHLTREQIGATIRETARVLRPSGRFLILQPNIRFCYRDYWMFFDHLTPLDDRSLGEALEINGFRVVDKIVRFLPYTTQGRLPNSLRLVRWYLRLPLVWRWFGAQSFLVAEPASSADPGAGP